MKRFKCQAKFKDLRLSRLLRRSQCNQGAKDDTISQAKWTKGLYEFGPFGLSKTAQYFLILASSDYNDYNDYYYNDYNNYNDYRNIDLDLDLYSERFSE